MENTLTKKEANNKLDEIRIWAKMLLSLSHVNSIEYRILSKLLKIIDK